MPNQIPVDAKQYIAEYKGKLSSGFIQNMESLLRFG